MRNAPSPQLPNQKRPQRFLLFVSVCLLALPLFCHLNDLPLFAFDESTLANGALEMNQNHRWMVVTLENEPDMSSPKPPLLIWMQAACMRLFGYHELAVRLPVAICAFILCLSLLFFSHKITGSLFPGLLAAFLLVTSAGFLRFHGSKTGDYDVPLTLFTTMACLTWFRVLEAADPKRRNSLLYLFFGFLCLGFFIKDIAALFILPGILIFTLCYPARTLALLKNRHFYLGMVLFLLPILAYFFVREHQTPGYLRALNDREFLGRFQSTIEDHTGGPDFYYALLSGSQLGVWFWVAAAGVVFAFCQAASTMRRLSLFLFAVAGSQLLLLSYSKTKLDWYTLPSLPLLTLMAGLLLYQVYRLISAAVPWQQVFRVNPLPWMMALILLPAYTGTVYQWMNPSFKDWELPYYQITYVLRDMEEGQLAYHPYKICLNAYERNISFYAKCLILDHKPVQIVPFSSLKSGDEVLCYETEIKEYIEQHFQTKIEGLQGNVRAYTLGNPKLPELLLNR